MRKNYFILLIAAICLALSVSYQWYTFDDEKYERIVDSDGKGYYAFLPAVFIYHDLSFKFFFERKNKDIKRYFHERFLVKQGDKTIIKTYCGESVLLMPFFLAGSLIQYAYEGTVNGYESIMQFFICIGALFYLALGLYYLRKFLRYYHIEERTITFSFFVFVFGTNMLYYAVFHPTMTHVYSFSLISIFLFFSKDFIETQKKKSLLLSALILGLIALVRPVNVVVIFIVPFLKKENGITFYIQHIKKNLGTWLWAIFITSLVISTQLLLNYLQCGKMLAWSYGDEGFYFLHPKLIDVFTSFRNGLLVYSPVLIIALIGFVFVFKKQRSLFWGLLITLSVTFYLISTWWSWYFGGGFGHRASIDWFGMFIIPFAFLFQNIDRMQERVVRIICIMLVIFNLFQTWQYLWSIIQPEGMTKEKYAYVFLKWSPEYYRCLGDGVERTYLPKQSQPFLASENTFESNPANWDSHPIYKQNNNSIALLNDTNEYGPTFIVKTYYPQFLEPFFLKVNLDRYENEFKACTRSLVIVNYENAEGEVYDSKNLRINDLPRKGIHQWKNFEYAFPLAPVMHKGDVLKVFIWNLDHKSFYIDNMRVQFYGYQKKASN